VDSREPGLGWIFRFLRALCWILEIDLHLIEGCLVWAKGGGRDRKDRVDESVGLALIFGINDTNSGDRILHQITLIRPLVDIRDDAIDDLLAFIEGGFEQVEQSVVVP
jgi:hypothetical protein